MLPAPAVAFFIALAISKGFGLPGKLYATRLRPGSVGCSEFEFQFPVANRIRSFPIESRTRGVAPNSTVFCLIINTEREHSKIRISICISEIKNSFLLKGFRKLLILYHKIPKINKKSYKIMRIQISNFNQLNFI